MFKYKIGKTRLFITDAMYTKTEVSVACSTAAMKCILCMKLLYVDVERHIGASYLKARLTSDGLPEIISVHHKVH